MKKKPKELGAAGAIDHATGTGFKRDKSTTRAVAWRMLIVPYLLRGEPVPPFEIMAKRAREAGIV